MHWETGEFHKNVLFETEAYITPHKHLAISGSATTVYFGNRKSNTTLFGRNTRVYAEDTISLEAVETITENAKKVCIETNNYSIIDDSCSIILTAGRAMSLNAKNHINIKSHESAVNIASKSHISLTPGTSIIITDYNRNVIYGPSLPNTGEEGRIFFKLIS